MPLTKQQKLMALKGLRIAYREVLMDWLKKHNKRGVKYTYLKRKEWVDEDGWNHLGEMEYVEPESILFDGQTISSDNFLPFLSVKKMNKLFNKAGFASLDFEDLAIPKTGLERLVDFFNDTYQNRFNIYARKKE